MGMGRQRAFVGLKPRIGSGAIDWSSAQLMQVINATFLGTPITLLNTHTPHLLEQNSYVYYQVTLPRPRTFSGARLAVQ